MESNYENELQDLHRLFEYSQQLMGEMLENEDKLHSEWYIYQAAFCLIACFESVGVALTFLPDSPVDSEFKAPAFTNLASSARLIHEGLYVTTYLLSEKSEEESELQSLVWQYHTERKRLAIVETFDPNNPDLDVLKNHVSNLRDNLEENQMFNALDNNKKNNILEGRTDRTMYRGEIEDLLNIDSGYLSSNFKFLSQYSHLTSYAANQVNAYGADPGSIPSGLSILVRDILCKYSLIVDRISETFETGMPPDVQDLTHHYIGVIENIDGKFAEVEEDNNDG